MIRFKVGLQSLPAQPAVQADLVAAALTMKEAVFCFNIMVELGFEKRFSTMPFYLDNTLTLHVPGNRTHFPWAKHVALMRYCFVQKLVEESKITVHYVNTQDQHADMAIKHLGRYHDRAFIKRINDFKACDRYSLPMRID